MNSNTNARLAKQDEQYSPGGETIVAAIWFAFYLVAIGVAVKWPLAAGTTHIAGHF